jgi:alpha-tubulin suppressor-like RCC1 family protein
MKLILIDSRLFDISVIISSLQSDTKYIIFDFYTDSLSDILDKIYSLNEHSFTSVAYMSHGVYNHTYKMVFKQTTPSRLIHCQDIDPNLDTWLEIYMLWEKIITTYNVTKIDYLGCCLIDKPEWGYIFNKFNTISSECIFRGSSNETGNMKGGDWILETDGTNVKDLYFTHEILEYKHNLYILNILKKKNYMKQIVAIPGTVVAWGDGGDISPTISGTLNTGSPVKSIFSTEYAFAALKTNGTVVSWGNSSYGGDISEISVTLNKGSPVKSIYSTDSAFAALKTNGTVVAWGNSSFGGVISQTISGKLNTGSPVKSIFSTEYAFAALKNNGTVVSWGYTLYGGDISEISGTPVISIFSTISAFAALKTNGTVLAWGDSSFGGVISPTISGKLNTGSPVKSIYSTERAFAALKTNGTVVAWGDDNNGGDISTISGTLNTDSPVKSIYSTVGAFAALKTNGTVVAWGDNNNGGDISKISGTLNTGSPVKSIYSTNSAFAALKNNGTVVAWGNSSFGGDISKISGTLNTGLPVKSIFSTIGAFAAIKSENRTQSIASFSDEDKIGLLKNPMNRPFISDTNLSVIGNSFLINGMIDGKEYKLIKNIEGTPISKSQLGDFVHIPIEDGEEVLIDGNIIVQYDEIPYLVENVNGFRTYSEIKNLKLFDKNYLISDLTLSTYDGLPGKKLLMIYNVI